MANNQVHLRLVNVTKRFGPVVAVDDVSFEIQAGTFTTLLGPSGCGKTTTLRMIAGFFDPDAGEIYLKDRKLNGIPPFARPTSMVFQDYALFPHMTVAQNVAYGLRMRREPRDVIAKKVKDVLALLGLEELAHRRPDRLSGGQQQRVSLARSLILEPEVLLLDEPLSNLDAKLRDRIKTELRTLQQKLGITTIYVTHDQQEALALSDQIAVMHAGKVLQLGTPAEIYYYPSSEFVADFVGTVNLIPGKVVVQHGDTCRVRTEFGEVTVETRHAMLKEGQAAVVSVRPETIRISPVPFPEGEDTVNAVQGTIQAASFVGKIITYWVDVQGTEIIVEHYNPGPGGAFTGTVYLAFDPTRMHVLPKETAKASIAG